MKFIPRFYRGGTKQWTAVLFSGLMRMLQNRSSVGSSLQHVVEQKTMRCYAISCELVREKRALALTQAIHEIAEEWQQPQKSLWLVRTALSAQDLRSALLPFLDFKDRLFICETGEDRVEFNALQSSGGRVLELGENRSRSPILSAIFSRNGTRNRHLKAATSRNLQSIEGRVSGSSRDETDYRRYYHG
jgi:hypothetical protein